MKTPSTEFADALAAAQNGGIKPRKLVWFDLVDGTSLGFWGGHEDITLSLTDRDGNSVTRTYYGNGELKSVSPIVYVSDLSIQPVTVTLSRIASHVQTAIYGHDPRLAAVEIHDALMQSSRVLAAAPELVWWGIIDSAPIQVPGIGQDSSIAISVVPQGIRLLTKTNSAKRSLESQKGRRASDELFTYANAAVSWQRFWGEAKSS